MKVLLVVGKSLIEYFRLVTNYDGKQENRTLKHEHPGSPLLLALAVTIVAGRLKIWARENRLMLTFSSVADIQIQLC